MTEIDTTFTMGKKGQDRDLSLYRENFASWCADNFGGAEPIDLAPISEDANGRAGEVFSFTLNDDQRLILRREATGAYLQHMDQDFESEYMVQRELYKKGIPVCKTYSFEEDESVLGSPFYIMDYVEGRVPPDEPSYHYSGWVSELSYDEQAQLCRNSLTALARVHNVNLNELSLGRLFERANPSFTHNEWLIDHWRRYHEWSRGEELFPLVSEALDWLTTNKIQNEPLAISWGDSRPGNTIYQGVECAALIDWDITHLAAPEKDLAWWITLDDFSTRRAGNVRLPGWLTFDEMIATYEQARGQAVDRDRLHYYTVFTGVGVALFIDRTLAISPDIDEQTREAMMASPEFSPLPHLKDIMDNKLW